MSEIYRTNSSFYLATGREFPYRLVPSLCSWQELSKSIDQANNKFVGKHLTIDIQSYEFEHGAFVLMWT